MLLDDIEGDSPHQSHVIFRVAEVRRRRVPQVQLKVVGRHRQQGRHDFALKTSVTLEQVEDTVEAGHPGWKVRALKSGLQGLLKSVKCSLK